MSDLTRRGLLGGFAAGFAASMGVFNAGCGQAGKEESDMKADAKPKLKQYKNEDFYTVDGKLDVEKTKQAYYELMEYHGFPVMPVLKTDEFWTLDFALGKFTEVGMGGIFYINNKRDNYLLHDIWLLPGQMIPEHSHVEFEDVAPKMEAWLVRHGSAWFGSEAEPTANAAEVIPPSHKDCAKARHVVKKGLGEVVQLETPKAWHWMKAGPEGAIVTEVATYHAMEALRFQHPEVKL
jgi:D-lyxose ketol-isomerase